MQSQKQTSDALRALQENLSSLSRRINTKIVRKSQKIVTQSCEFVVNSSASSYIVVHFGFLRYFRKFS